MMDMDPDDFFVPNKKAKHKAPQVFSSSNPTQKRKDQQQQKKKPKKACVEISSSEESNEDLQQYTDVCKRVEEDKLQRNPPYIVFLRGLISKCSGCNFKFTAPQHRLPQDMVFKYMMFCKCLDGRGGEKECATRSPAYFHSGDLACLRELEELEDIQMKDIYITNNVFNNLSRRHIHELKKHRMWGPLIATCTSLNQVKVQNLNG